MAFPKCLLAMMLSTGLVSSMRRRITEMKEMETERQGVLVAGVPVLNYHLAFKGKSFRHTIKDPKYAASLASMLELKLSAREEDWVVMLNADVPDEKIHEACRKATATCTIEGHSKGLPFIALHGTEAELQQVIEAVGGAKFVEVDIPIGAVPEVRSTELDKASWAPSDKEKRWHLSHIGTDKTTRTGRGVHVYVLDTGILTTHHDFGGRADAFADTFSLIGFPTGLCQKSGGWFPPPEDCANDVQGHGTHCAGTVGGSTWGVAPEASLHAVKVLGDQGSGSLSSIISGMDIVATSGQRPAVLSMSLGALGYDRGIAESLTAVVESGLTVVVAAGNEFTDSCGGSVAGVPAAITVGATTSKDERSYFSNFGPCTDIYAPGSDIWSAGLNLDLQNGSLALSGTSMACPAVSGAVALLLEANPALQPNDIRAALQNNSAVNYVSNLSPEDIHNKLLYVGEDGPAPPRAVPPNSTEEWPPQEYWNACEGKGAVGPRSVHPFGLDSNNYRLSHCVCDSLTFCYANASAEERGCPLSPNLQAWADMMPILPVASQNFIWNCTDCACYGPLGGIR